MPNVLLIRPKNIYNQNNYPSLGLLSIATSLFYEGYKTYIINAAMERNWKNSIAQTLGHFPKFIGVTIMTSECPNAYEIIKFIKSLVTTPIIVGGWHARLFPEQLDESRLINCVVSGEGELDILETEKRDFMLGDMILKHTNPELNDLPTVKYDLDPDIEKYINSYLTDPIKPKRWLPYESSRGCPGECSFCCNTAVNNRYRKKHAIKTAFEMVEIANKYKLDHIKIIDDNFFVRINHVRYICKLILESGKKFTWDAECRPDYFRDKHLDDDTIRLCKRAGLVQLTLGLESGSQRTLDVIKKHITPKQSEYAVSQCARHGIIARCSFIIDVPGETSEDIELTRKFIRKLRKYPNFTCGVQTFRPYPKCELTQNLINEGLWKEPESFEDFTNKEYVKQFTAAQSKLPWQNKHSYRVASYEYMESGINHRQGFLCWILRTIARARNTFKWYYLPLDLWLYNLMVMIFLIKQEKKWQKKQKKNL